MSYPVYTEVSARHIHFAEKDFKKLFGAKAQLKKLRPLYLPTIFACQQTIEVKIGQRALERVRVIGPFRAQTQIEISTTDAYSLKAQVPLRLSGDLTGSQGCTLIGPRGKLDLPEGMIVAKRHLHISKKQATAWKLKHHQKISIQIENARGLIFDHVIVRVSRKYKTTFHLDTDEGNAAGIVKNTEGKIYNQNICASS